MHDGWSRTYCILTRCGNVVGGISDWKNYAVTLFVWTQWPPGQWPAPVCRTFNCWHPPGIWCCCVLLIAVSWVTLHPLWCCCCCWCAVAGIINCPELIFSLRAPHCEIYERCHRPAVFTINNLAAFLHPWSSRDIYSLSAVSLEAVSAVPLVSSVCVGYEWAGQSARPGQHRHSLRGNKSCCRVPGYGRVWCRHWRSLHLLILASHGCCVVYDGHYWSVDCVIWWPTI